MKLLFGAFLLTALPALVLAQEPPHVNFYGPNSNGCKDNFLESKYFEDDYGEQLGQISAPDNSYSVGVILHGDTSYEILAYDKIGTSSGVLVDWQCWQATNPDHPITDVNVWRV